MKLLVVQELLLVSMVVVPMFKCASGQREVEKDSVFKCLEELVGRSIEIILMGNRREGVSLLTPGEVLHHMALRVRQGE